MSARVIVLHDISSNIVYGTNRRIGNNAGRRLDRHAAISRFFALRLGFYGAYATMGFPLAWLIAVSEP
jgi:hypothetical protein